MHRFLRVLKASAVIGAVWAVVWGLLGFGLALFQIRNPFPFTAMGLLGFLTGSSAALGFLGGSAFSLALSGLQRRMSLEQLNPIVVGLAGGVGGGVALPLLGIPFELFVPGTSVLVNAVTIGAFSAFGTVSAIATLLVARAGPALPDSASREMLSGS